MSDNGFFFLFPLHQEQKKHQTMTSGGETQLLIEGKAQEAVLVSTDYIGVTASSFLHQEQKKHPTPRLRYGWSCPRSTPSRRPRRSRRWARW
jgi:hypothetical protein